MPSQAYSNNDVLLFLQQIWKTSMLMFLWLRFVSPHFGREECWINSEFRKQQHWGDKKNNIQEESNWKYFHSS